MVHSSFQPALLSAMQSLSEADLTKKYLIPLFEAMGFIDVEYHGGPNEHGKDVLMWDTNKLGRKLLIVVQVKKLKLSAKAESKDSVPTVVSQLNQAALEPIPCQDGHSHKASSIWLVTPYPLVTRSLQSHVEGLMLARDRQLEIVDGKKILYLLDEWCPELVKNLGGHEYAVRTTVDIQAHNKTLLDALDSTDSKELSTLYCEIFFGLSSTHLLNQSRKDSVGSFEGEFDLVATAWKSIQATDASLRSLVAVGILTDDVSTVEDRYRQSVDLYEQNATKRKEIFLKLDEVKKRIASTLTDKHSLEDDRVRKFAIALKPSTIGPSISKDESAIRSALSSNKISSHVASIAAQIVSLIDGLRGSLSPGPRYTPTLSAREFLAYLEKVGEHVNRLAATLRKSSSTAALRDLLCHFDSIQKCIQALSQDKVARRLLEDGRVSEQLRALSELQLRIPLHRAFDTGLDMTVLGGAGAGKTTNLQVYAKLVGSRTNKQQLVLLASLPALVRHMDASAKDPSLERAIAKHLSDLGYPVNESILTASLEKKSTVALLDSIDEAIASFPGIIKCIEAFKKRFSKLQVITTSRMSGSLAERAPFLHLVLLPFTPEQRDGFIDNWFAQDAHDAQLVKAHLSRNKELSEVVRNPLLATILCVLQRNKVELPLTEANLYKHRFELLSGLFDRFKGVKRLRSRGQVLETVAKALAFQFHDRKIREAKESDIKRWAQERIGALFQESDVITAVDELVHPCDLLVKTDTGHFDFGHLRFQEHLAAWEMSENRSIAVERLLTDPWWSDVFVLYAQMSKDLSWILDRASAAGVVVRAQQTLKAMFDVRRDPERLELLKKLAARSLLEREEGGLAFDDISEAGEAAIGSADEQYTHLSIPRALSQILWNVDVDVEDRTFIWPGARRLSLDESVQRIRSEHPEISVTDVHEFLRSWIKGNALEEDSFEESDELDHLADVWIDELRTSSNDE